MKGDPVVDTATIEYAQGLFDLRFLDGSARATFVMSDGKTRTFDWFHDEISFVSKDFIGRTMDEIRKLKRERDLAYLRS